MTTLNEALDLVWRGDGPRLEAATAALRDMDVGALLEMVKLVLLARAGAKLIIVDGGEPGTLLLRYRETGLSTQAHLGPAFAHNAVLRLSDIDKALVAAEDGFAQAWGSVIEDRACAILSAQQFARDHIDALLYQPPHIRERRLEQIGADFGMSAELLMKLASQVRGRAAGRATSARAAARGE
ncbi:MAG: hypothetical protein E6G97_25595 [Alphaproteobacteria bacterium]|nr:MAG: hypothetical protein E6G97_25595 [Alphaproteobacteria bacterium]